MLRISGLVRLMNQVRDSLNAGIPPGEEDNFRRMVQGSVRQIEEICRQHQISPDKLPSPSYRAYRYLKELDLNVLPVANQPPAPNPGPLRIRNLISACRAIQDELAGLALAENKSPVNKKDANPSTAVLRAQILALASSVKAAIESAGSSESSLSSQSQRSYRWIQYLSQETHLEEHIAALRIIHVVIEQAKNESKILKRRLKTPIRFELSNLPAIYMVKLGVDGLVIQAHEGFVGAPDRVIKSLVMAALAGKGARNKEGQLYLDGVKEYANSEAFQRIASQVDIARMPRNQSSRGQHFDLEAVFHKVNGAYFGGQIPKPHLTWNKTLTHRKFGHYHAASDTVMLSISLDRASTPAFVVEFVMYHELLHKHLGTSSHKGRQYSHTRAFREAEARFPKHRQAVEALNKLGGNLMKGKL